MNRYKGSHEKATEKPEFNIPKMKIRRIKLTKPVIIMCSLILVFVLLAGAAAAVFSYYTGKLNIVDRGAVVEKVSTTPPPVDGESAEKLKELEAKVKESLDSDKDWDFTSNDVTNILLIGVDNTSIASLNERGNADGLIIVSINNKTKQIVLTSLMRDIFAYVPDKNYFTKLTLAYHYAGTEALINTVESNFENPIDNYIMVNYLTIVDIVDAVGGLAFDVDKAELYFMKEKIEQLNAMLGKPITENIIEPSQAGELTLNGIQTAAYMRIRYAGDGDLDRTERARDVIIGLKDKALKMNLTQLNNLAEVALPNITTDMDQSEMFGFLLNAAKLLKYEMVSSRIPIDDSFHYEDIGGSMVVIDFDANREHLHKTIYDGISK